MQVQPWLASDPTKMSQLSDALQLTSLCNKNPSKIPMLPPLNQQANTTTAHSDMATVTSAPALRTIMASRHPSSTPASSIVFYVDAVTGDDNQPFSPSSGGIATPFKTIQTAVDACRAVRSTQGGLPATVFLRGNAVHYLANTITLGAQDSGLSIMAYMNESVMVSGGVHVEAVKWTQGSNGIYTADLSDVELPAGVTALQYGNPMARSRATLARFPNANPELDLFPIGYVTAKTNWRPPLYRGEPCNPRDQCGQSVNVTYVTPESEWHGTRW